MGLPLNCQNRFFFHPMVLVLDWTEHKKQTTPPKRMTKHRNAMLTWVNVIRLRISCCLDGQNSSFSQNVSCLPLDWTENENQPTPLKIIKFKNTMLTFTMIKDIQCCFYGLAEIHPFPKSRLQDLHSTATEHQKQPSPTQKRQNQKKQCLLGWCLRTLNELSPDRPK